MTVPFWSTMTLAGTAPPPPAGLQRAGMRAKFASAPSCSSRVCSRMTALRDGERSSRLDPVTAQVKVTVSAERTVVSLAEQSLPACGQVESKGSEPV